ncbi:hypothetical protein K439DRAFT_1624978 [Ramaria rubella]|nr:hypothetical protein K439DRAFT_1624978 [Ramaria rubella]
MCGTLGGGGTAQPEALGLGERTTSQGRGLHDIGSRHGGIVSLVFLGQCKNPAVVQSVSIVCHHDRLYGSLLAILGGCGAHGHPPVTVRAAPRIGTSSGLVEALYMDDHGDHPFVLARADAGEPLGELDARLCALALGTNVRLHHVAMIHGAGPSIMVHCQCVCMDTGDPARTQQRYTGGESVGRQLARKVAHSFGLSDPAVWANTGWVMSPVASACLHKCQQGSVGVAVGGWPHVVVESMEGRLVYGTRRVRLGWQ